MKKSYELKEHIGGGMIPSFYVDGKRVSNHDYSLLSNAGHGVNGDTNCFSTKCRYVGDGKLRRTNYKIVTIYN